MPLTLNEIRSRAHRFTVDWKDVTSERAEAQTFWNELLKVFGIERRRVASYEKSVERLGDKSGRIDLFWPSLLLAEHKSAGENMEKATVQAFSYLSGLKNRELPRYIIVSDFQRFKLFDLDANPIEETAFTLSELPDKIELLSFIAGYTPKAYKDEDPINIKAAEKLGDLYDALRENGYEEHALKVFLVRLLFILFAEDTGIFDKDLFRWCIENKTFEDGSDTGRFIIDLFAVLDSPENARQRNTDEDLTRFCYVNGSLFNENFRPPSFNTKARDMLLDLASIRWNEVSPAIFGSLFQTCLSDKPEERRQLGAHYTSEKNILKIVKGLFLDDLKAELDQILQDRSTRKKARLEAFQQKLRSLKFLDPACGCGNFLVIAYRELRLLEIEVIKTLEEIEQQASGGQLRADSALRSIVNVDQFYGIEIEELPVQIARVALWLTDHQMNIALAQETGLYHLRLPLKTEPHITEGNALRMDWSNFIPKRELSYVLGNPPFKGKNDLTNEQKEDIQNVLAPLSKRGQCDYVTCWYVKALDYIRDTNIQCAFVSTSSITQGQQVSALWPYLLNHGFEFKFAHRTFKWTNEARGKAAVYVIIVGFSLQQAETKYLYHYEDLAGEPLEVKAEQISPYLIDMEPVIVGERTKPILNVPPMINGSKAADGSKENPGKQLLMDEAEKEDFLRAWPEAKRFIKPLLGSDEFINGYTRYCIWLYNVPPNEYRHIKGIMERVEAVRKYRASSRKIPTQKMADFPSIFAEIRQTSGNYIFVPSVSSEHRYYVPLAFLSPDYIVTNLAYQIPNTSLYHFGVVQSHMHMAWMRQVCGRLEGRYRYSNKIVYNNFPWPENPSKAQLEKVETYAQAILDVRQPYLDKGNTLADLYAPNAMPPDLLKVHQALNKAVDACYGKNQFSSELDRVKYLFQQYQRLVGAEQQSLLESKSKKPTRARSRKS